MDIDYKLPPMKEAYAKLTSAQAAEWFTKEGYRAYSERKVGTSDKDWAKVMNLRQKLVRLMNGGSI